jgi:hypothetical protein
MVSLNTEIDHNCSPEIAGRIGMLGISCATIGSGLTAGLIALEPIEVVAVTAGAPGAVSTPLMACATGPRGPCCFYLGPNGIGYSLSLTGIQFRSSAFRTDWPAHVK